MHCGAQNVPHPNTFTYLAILPELAIRTRNEKSALSIFSALVPGEGLLRKKIRHCRLLDLRQSGPSVGTPKAHNDRRANRNYRNGTKPVEGDAATLIVFCSETHIAAVMSMFVSKYAFLYSK